MVIGHENITASKLAEEQLLDRERMLRQSQRIAHVGSWEMDLLDRSDLGQNAVRWSDECIRIFGLEPGRVAVTGAVTPGSSRRRPRGDRRRDDQGAAEQLYVRDRASCFAPDGVERVVQEWVEVVTDSAGLPIRMIGICQDVTDHKQAARGHEALCRAA